MIQFCILPFAYAGAIYDWKTGKYQPVGKVLPGAGIYDIEGRKKPVLVFPTGDWTGKKIPYSRDFQLSSLFYDPCPELISNTLSWRELIGIAKTLGIHGPERKVYVEYGDKGLLWPAGYISSEWLSGIKERLEREFPGVDAYLTRSPRSHAPVCVVWDEEKA